MKYGYEKVRLAQIKKGKFNSIDFILLGIVIILIAIGIVMVFSSSMYVSGHSASQNYDYAFYLKKQILWVLIGTVAMIFIQRSDYHKLRKYIIPLMVITFILLLLVFTFPAVKGAKRWIPLGGLGNIQPSEIAKYVIVIYIANSIEIKGSKMKGFIDGVLPHMLISGLYAAIILKEPSMSIAIVIMATTFIMLFVAGVRIRYLLIFISCAFSLGYYFIINVSFRTSRIIGFLHPFENRNNEGYQLVQSLLAIGSGGIFGVGLGNSKMKAFFLPEASTDFIFSIVGEEFGLIGCLFIIILYIMLIYRGIRIAMTANDKFGQMLAIGITSVISIQTIINIAVVTGSIPPTGVPLPFISYGGSSLLFNMISIGILMNISRQSDIQVQPTHYIN